MREKQKGILFGTVYAAIGIWAAHRFKPAGLTRELGAVDYATLVIGWPIAAIREPLNFASSVFLPQPRVRLWRF